MICKLYQKGPDETLYFVEAIEMGNNPHQVWLEPIRKEITIAPGDPTLPVEPIECLTYHRWTNGLDCMYIADLKEVIE